MQPDARAEGKKQGDVQGRGGDGRQDFPFLYQIEYKILDSAI